MRTHRGDFRLLDLVEGVRGLVGGFDLDVLARPRGEDSLRGDSHAVKGSAADVVTVRLAAPRGD